EIGTSCIHRPQTHAVVRFFRELVDLASPGTLLVTETNVPHEENIQYFGKGDEAHLVYQFSLPPLLLDAWLNEDASPLVGWLAGLSPARPGTAYFNFTASHDGIGVRPLEGLVPESRIGRLADSVIHRGGLVSMRHGPGGRDVPYELNCTFFDAVADPAQRDSDVQVQRFLSSQALALALRGIPGVYFSSLFGAGNDLDGVRRSGQPRRINRRKFSRGELAEVLEWSGNREARVLSGYRRLLRMRRQQPAFHPDAAQEVWSEVPPWLVAVLRTSLNGRQRILVLVNASGRSQRWELARDMAFCPERELLGGEPWAGGMYVELEPFQTLWLESTE
ncbi:MAG: alpha-amylase family glycosyl hydrolase, partial [Thermoguttaceae bacterium]